MKTIIFYLSVKTILISVVLMVATLFLLSCPNPLDEIMLLQVLDEVAPAISILSPSEGSSYAATVIVTGIVSDSSTSDGGDGGIGSLFYKVMGTSLEGIITPTADGFFTFNFPTTNLSGSIVIQIIAGDWNGNEFSESLTLVDLGAIPTFSVDPGNGKVTVTWDSVPMVESYTLFYETADIIPNELYTPQKQTVTEAVSGIIIPDLINGNIHTFLLKANSITGDDNWSEIERVIPLSSAHLAPNLTQEYHSILVQWNTILGTEDYEVWKATNREGPFSNISGSISKDYFRDTGVVKNQDYYYAVKPATDNNSLSGANAVELPGFIFYNERDLIGSYDTPYSATGVTIKNSYAYIADRDSGLRIIDISNPFSPFEVGFYNTPGSAYGVAVSGSYAYIADGTAGLRIIDISVPSLPSEIAYYDTPGNSYSVSISGSYAYIADDNSGIRIIDISDLSTPTTPSEISYFNNIESAYWIDLSNDYAYVAAGNGLSIIDISIPASPIEVGFVATPGIALGVDINNNYAYVTNEDSGLRIINISIPSTPFEVGYFDTTGDAVRVAVNNSKAFVTDNSHGLKIIDISTPDSPSELSFLSTPGVASQVIVSGSYAYVADGDEFRIIDITNPMTPIEVGFLYIEYIESIAINGNFAYVTDGSGIYIIDISNPQTPAEVGFFETSGDASEVVVSGIYAYVADYNTGMSIIDISNPSFPTEIAFFDSLGAFSIDVEGLYAFIASSYGLQIVELLQNL